ncbi:hypothetical protein HDV63DRAFT_158340 [Trichoderma sp. SZMC 28014]
MLENRCLIIFTVVFAIPTIGAKSPIQYHQHDMHHVNHGGMTPFCSLTSQEAAVEYVIRFQMEESRLLGCPAAVTGRKVHEYVHCIVLLSSGRPSLPVSWGFAGRFRNRWELLRYSRANTGGKTLVIVISVRRTAGLLRSTGFRNAGMPD